MLILLCIAGVFYVVNYPRRQLLIVCAVMSLIAFCALYCIKRGYNKENVIILSLLTLSGIVKADYVIYTPCYVRQHDVIGFGAGFGQAAFIEYFYEKIRLIDFDPRTLWGFFQPPLHHMISGLWLRLMDFICPNFGWACDNVQLLTLVYSLLIPFVSLAIFRKIGLHNKGLMIAMLFVCAHPTFILLSGSINNDILCILLQLLAMYYFICWNSEIDKDAERKGILSKELVYIMLSALFLGLSMMTKLSGILIAPAMGIVMLMRLKNKNLVKIITEYFLFAVISIPIGIWSPVRNLILFGVPLNFTPEVGEPLTGNSLLARIIDIRTRTPFTNLIDSGSTYDEFNFFLGMLKTSLFGEYTFADIPFATAAGWVLLLSGVVLSIFILVSAIKMIFNKDVDLYLRVFVSTYSLVTMVFYVNLCFSIPNFSSLDFRYIAHLIVLGGIYLGFYVNRIVTRVLLIFSLASVSLYLLIGIVSWR